MAGNRALDHDAAIRDFHTKLQEYTMRAVCGRSYVLTEKLEKWLRSKVWPDSTTTQAGRLLLAAYCARTRNRPGLPISDEFSSSEDDCCIIVFSILLELGLGKLVDTFQRHDIVDRLIPVPLESLRKELKLARVLNAESVAAQFDQVQWRYRPAKFELHKEREHPRKAIIPICRKEKINDKGGTARLWLIDVQEDFIGPKLRKAAFSSRFDFNSNGSKDESDYRYQFALKTFDDGNRIFYKNEKEAFQGLRHHKGMVQYLGDYGHQEIQRLSDSSGIDAAEGRKEQTKTTYNILLEFGDMDLDEFFAERLPPVLQIEVSEFWKALFEVADAVDGIHNLKISTAGLPQEYYGWHADIKPDNILNVERKFKLADPGFAKFVKKTEADPEEFILGGTETYGAPERHPDRRGSINAVPQTIDIWSLGCVFSIAATWVVLGYQGIRQYGRMREKAIRKIIQDQREHHSQERTPWLSEGDYFHDGRQVLDDVINWHQFLRDALRKTDTMTSRVLDLVDQKMLLGTAKNRIQSKELCKELRGISASSLAEGRKELPQSIMSALLEADEEASSKVVDSIAHESLSRTGHSLTLSYDRKSRKSKLLDLPLMKTTHRSEYLKSALASQQTHTVSHETIYDSSGTDFMTGRASAACGLSLNSSSSSPRRTLPHVETAPVSRGDSSRRVSSVSSLSPTITPKKRIKKHKTHATQDVFQAREEIEKHGRRSLLRRRRKDEVLSMYFGNRDIKFLVDNGESMKEHWYQATYLLETLVMKAAGQDENGMDLAFTNGTENLENQKSASEFKKKMKTAEPRLGARTDMRNSLGEIFSAYLQDRKVMKKLTLVVLTDGIWAGMGNNKDDVNNQIVQFIKKLESKIGNLSHRPVSIEFVQFGEDLDATYRLRRLDDDLKWEGVPDIIDTEPSLGDLNKMLLGSFVAEYDEEDEDEAANFESLTQRIGSSDDDQRMISSAGTQFSTSSHRSPIDATPR